MKKVSFGSRPQAAPPATAEDWVADRETLPEPIKRLTIDIPLGLHRRVKSHCALEGTPIAEVVRDYLERRFPADTETQKDEES